MRVSVGVKVILAGAQSCNMNTLTQWLTLILSSPISSFSSLPIPHRSKKEATYMHAGGCSEIELPPLSQTLIEITTT